MHTVEVTAFNKCVNHVYVNGVFRFFLLFSPDQLWHLFPVEFPTVEADLDEFMTRIVVRIQHGDQNCFL